jgi:hypothetical protein
VILALPGCSGPSQAAAPTNEEDTMAKKAKKAKKTKKTRKKK